MRWIKTPRYSYKNHVLARGETNGLRPKARNWWIQSATDNLFNSQDFSVEIETVYPYDFSCDAAVLLHSNNQMATM